MSRDDYFKWRDGPDTRDEVRSVSVAVSGNEALDSSCNRIAAKSYDAPYAKILILASDLIDLDARCRNASQMRGDVERRLA